MSSTTSRRPRRCPRRTSTDAASLLSNQRTDPHGRPGPFRPPRRRFRTSRQSRRPDGRVDRRTRRAFATEDDEPAEDRERGARSRDPEPLEDGGLRRAAGRRALVNRSRKTRSTRDALGHCRRASFAPCPERLGGLLRILTAVPPLRSRLRQPPETLAQLLRRKPRTIRTRPREAPRDTAPLNATAMVAAALTGGLRRAEPPPRPPRPTALPTTPARRRPPLLDRLAVKSILDNLRRPEAKAPASGRRQRRADESPIGRGRRGAEGRFPCRRFPRQAWRLHRRPHASPARRGSDQGRFAGRNRCSCLAGSAGTAGDDRNPLKIRDAANANGGIERVLSEMRPGGAFEDLRKEFNVALSHDEGFAGLTRKRPARFPAMPRREPE